MALILIYIYSTQIEILMLFCRMNLTGLEPVTFRLSVERSSQLSYRFFQIVFHNIELNKFMK